MLTPDLTSRLATIQALYDECTSTGAPLYGKFHRDAVETLLAIIGEQAGEIGELRRQVAEVAHMRELVGEPADY